MTGRYSRQELFSKIGKEGQRELRDATVAIIGVGGLGTVAAELLARAGVGNLVLIDRDVVELSNLQRQLLFDMSDVGKAKAYQAKERLQRINPNVRIEAHAMDINSDNIELLYETDIVLDCTDNLETRFLINDYAIKYPRPWVYGAVVGDKGFVKAFIQGGPCFRCVFEHAEGLGSCDTLGVMNSAVSIVAALQVTEAIKIILEEEPADMMHVSVWNPQIQMIKTTKRDQCPACLGDYEYLSGEKTSKILKFCGSGNYQFTAKSFDLKELKSRLAQSGEVEDLGYALKFKGMTIFEDGRTLVKANDETEAKSLYAKYVGA